MMGKITIGADPELFFHNERKFISAIGKIGGTKTEPRRLLGDFALQEDNVTVEYNIPPCDSSEKFVWANQLMLNEIAKIAERYECKPMIASSGEFDAEELADPRALVFGCDPDFNAWELEPNARPKSDNAALRSAGGHIHIGIDAPVMDKVLLVRALDLNVGMMLAFMDPESQRRELYGKAGACRVKPYGVEYRTPSNVWLKDESVMQGVFNAVIQTVDNYKGMRKILETHGEKIQNTINKLDPTHLNELVPLIGDYWMGQHIKALRAKMPKAKARAAAEGSQWVEMVINAA